MRPETDMTPQATGRATAHRPAGRHPRRAILIGLVPAAAIAAACGSSSTTSSTTTSRATTSTSAAAAPAIQTANNAKFGTILVDGQGRTLYTLTNNGAAVSCSAACLAIWPPSLLPAGQTTVNAGPGVNNVSTVNASGGIQVAYKNLPLYRFSADATTGAANGDGINSFGGVWHVVKVSGASTGSTGGGTATTGGAGTTSTTAGGGYSGGGY